MPVLRTRTVYLEMRAPPIGHVASPAADIDILLVSRPSVEYYRFLYRGVGADYHWVDRLVMPSGQLEQIIQDERVDIYVLTLAGVEAGFAELDRRQPQEIELAYFGLFPAAIGKGLGKYLLRRILDVAWVHEPNRVWLHTCDLDHPAALRNYQQAGFTIYEQTIVEQWVPESQPGG